MRRGTTPTLTFTLPEEIDISNISGTYDINYGGQKVQVIDLYVS